MRKLLADLTNALVRRGIPELFGLTDSDFLLHINQLGSQLKPEHERGHTGNIPLCIAFQRGAADLDRLMARVEARSATGVVDMTPVSPESFEIIDEVVLPRAPFYLLIDVDTGRNLLNVSPENALIEMKRNGRTPLTMDEGVALALQYPELFTDRDRYNCIQMPGSRAPGDQRVPSIWFSRGEPRLGWCWDRNIHTWLGSASARLRVGDPQPSGDESGSGG